MSPPSARNSASAHIDISSGDIPYCRNPQLESFRRNQGIVVSGHTPLPAAPSGY
jgi:hypothetical protein